MAFSTFAFNNSKSNLMVVAPSETRTSKSTRSQEHILSGVTMPHLLHGTFRASDCCLRCGNEVKSIKHLVFFFPFAQAVWRASCFSYSLSPLGFPGSVGHAMGCVEPGGKCFYGILMCAIKGPHKQLSSPTRAVDLVSSPAGITKICCNAAFNKLKGKAAAAAVARDSTGAIVHGNTIGFLASSASSAEASAIRLGVSLALNVGLENVIFESDCLGVVKRLNSGVLSAWESAAIKEDILSMASLFSSFPFSFIPRACNRVADWIAKNALNLSCPVDWVNNVPLGLWPFL
ncbi:hypothetical protein GQ457_07G006960 [Hibiscus cannabinus]